jgi:hypothetical protein
MTHLKSHTRNKPSQFTRTTKRIRLEMQNNKDKIRPGPRLVQSQLPFAFLPHNAVPPAAHPPAAHPARPPVALGPSQAHPPPPPLPQEQLNGIPVSTFASGATSIAHWEDHYQKREQEHGAFLHDGYRAANLQGLEGQETALLKKYEEQLVEKDAEKQVVVEVLGRTIQTLQVDNARLTERAAQLSAELAAARQLIRTAAMQAGMYSCYKHRNFSTNILISR